jgi:hypothetical protein
MGKTSAVTTGTMRHMAMLLPQYNYEGSPALDLLYYFYYYSQ